MSAAKPTRTPAAPGRPIRTVASAKLEVAPAAKRSAAAPPGEVSAKPKHKLVRDSFTIPKSEYSVLQSLKARAEGLAHPVKKSELLRAGIAVLDAMTDKSFLMALNRIPILKTGRPKGRT